VSVYLIGRGVDINGCNYLGSYATLWMKIRLDKRSGTARVAFFPLKRLLLIFASLF
jgi:hypothetical protein